MTVVAWKAKWDLQQSAAWWHVPWAWEALMALGGGKDRKERHLQRVDLSLGGRWTNQTNCEALWQQMLTGGEWNSDQGGKVSPRCVQQACIGLSGQPQPGRGIISNHNRWGKKPVFRRAGGTSCIIRGWVVSWLQSVLGICSSSTYNCWIRCWDHCHSSRANQH